MIPTIGQTVHFYRDKDFPGKRGPYAARIIGMRSPKYCPVHFDLSVTGDTGQTWAEYTIPFLSGEFTPPDERYCTVIEGAKCSS